MSWRRQPMRRLRRWMKVLMGRELAHRLDVRCHPVWHGSDYGGWYVCPRQLAPGSVVYAFGIGEDISFERSLAAALEVEIHSFDFTPRSLSWLSEQCLPGGMTVHPWGLLDIDGTVRIQPPARPDHVSHTVLLRAERGAVGTAPGLVVPVYRLSTICQRLGHDRIDLLKMDVEGAEYRILGDLEAGGAPRPRQLLVEFHHGHHGIEIEETRRAVTSLRDMGYRLAAVSPSGRELTFLHTPQ